MVGGGRYERYEPGDVADLFAACERTPSMRSVSAVLRITREQLLTRSEVTHYPKAVVILFIISLGLLGAVFFAPANIQGTLKATAGAAGFVTLLYLYGSLSSSHVRREAVAQGGEIRRLAVESLRRILAHDFPRKPLIREHVELLKDLRRQVPDSAFLEGLLEWPLPV